MKRSYIKRKQELKRVHIRRQRKSLNPIGKRGRENQKVCREKKQELLNLSIVTCEARLDGCTYDNYLSFAHTRKRRHMGKWESAERELNMKESACLCWNCHWNLEKLGEEKMAEEIRAIMARRDDLRTEAA